MPSIKETRPTARKSYVCELCGCPIEQVIFACDSFCKACANNPCGGVCRQNCKKLDNFINELREGLEE